MILLNHKILKKLVLRRTKIGRASDVALPPSTVSCFPCGYNCSVFNIERLDVNFFYVFLQVSVRMDFLDREELDYYETLYGKFQAKFDRHVILFLRFN